MIKIIRTDFKESDRQNIISDTCVYIEKLTDTHTNKTWL